jgi:hypothetical protein
MKYGIVSMPQDIGQTQCANQTIVIIAKCMFKAQKLEKML